MSLLFRFEKLIIARRKFALHVCIAILLIGMLNVTIEYISMKNKDLSTVFDIYRGQYRVKNSEKPSIFVKIGDQRVYLFSAFWTRIENPTQAVDKHILDFSDTGIHDTTRNYTIYPGYLIPQIAIIGWEQTELAGLSVQCCYLSTKRSFYSLPVRYKRNCCYRDRKIFGDVQSWITYYACPLVELERLAGISVAVNRSDCPREEKEYIYPLVPRSPKGLSKGTKSIGACIKVVYGNIDARKLIEWLEVHKLFGVDKVIGHVYNVSSQVKEVFRYYGEQGWLEIYPFDVPDTDYQPRRVGLPTWQHWNDEHAALLYCQERLKLYDFIAMYDLDEYFVPSNTPFKNAWKIFLTNYFKNPKVAGIYTQWNYHLFNWGPSNKEHPLFIGKYSAGSTEQFDANKVIFMPSRILPGTATAHKVDAAPGFSMVKLNVSEGIIHHYRKCRVDWKEHYNASETNFYKQCQNINRVRNFNMEDLGFEVAEKVLAVRRKLNI